MRVLVVTNMYPSERHPTDGIFIKRQIDALALHYSDVTTYVSYVDTVRKKSRYITGARKVARDFSIFRPDIVHIHYGLSQLLCWRLPNIPTVVTFHGSDLTIAWQQKLGTLLLNRRHRVVVVTERLRVFLQNRDDAVAIPCGVDASAFNWDREVARAHIGIDTLETLVVFGANPARPVKRYDRFLEVISAMQLNCPRIKVLRLSDVALLSVPILLAAADLVLLTSDREGSPVVTKEALCSGARVVSTPVGDVSDQLDGFSGCAVAGWQTGDLASAALRVIAEPAPDRQIARQRFDVSNESAALMKIYRSMVQF